MPLFNTTVAQQARSESPEEPRTVKFCNQDIRNCYKKPAICTVLYILFKSSWYLSSHILHVVLCTILYPLGHHCIQLSRVARHQNRSRSKPSFSSVNFSSQQWTWIWSKAILTMKARIRYGVRMYHSYPAAEVYHVRLVFSQMSTSPPFYAI